MFLKFQFCGSKAGDIRDLLGDSNRGITAQRQTSMHKEDERGYVGNG